MYNDSECLLCRKRNDTLYFKVELVLDVGSIGNVPKHFGESVHCLSGQFVQRSCKKLENCTTCRWNNEHVNVCFFNIHLKRQTPVMFCTVTMVSCTHNQVLTSPKWVSMTKKKEILYIVLNIRSISSVRLSFWGLASLHVLATYWITRREELEWWLFRYNDWSDQ